MPYSKSRARKEFESGSSKLLQLARKVSYKSSPLTYDHKQLINQSSIFLLSARIEDFTKNLIEDLLYNYRNKGAILKHIPSNIRTKALLDKQISFYRNFYNSSDERSLLRHISIGGGCYDIMDDNANFTSQIRPINIIGTNKYPSIKNLKILYYRIGINDIINDLNRRAKKDIKTNIESFLSLRESIAHQGATAVTYIDVKRHFRNIGEAIKYIDKIVYSHIANESGEAYWA